MRVHGTAERLAPAAGAALALGGVVVMLVGLVGFFTAPAAPGVLGAVSTILLVGVGPAATSLSAVALARDLGLTTARGTVVGAVASTLAWVLATVASVSWEAGFQQADAGVELSPFAEAFPVLLAGALAGGVVALTPAIAGALRGVRAARGRWALAVTCAVPCAVVVGATTVSPAGALLAALVLLVVCGLRWLPAGGVRLRDTAGSDRARAPGPAPGVGRPTGLPHRRVVIALAGASGALSLPCALYALLGAPDALAPTWLPAAVERLPPMNAGLAGGALASLPLVAAAGLAAPRRWGNRASVAASLMASAVVMRAVSAAMGPSGDAPTFVLFAAGVLAGVAMVVPLAPRLPGPRASRWALVAVIGAGTGWVLGLPALAVLPLVSPLAASALVVAAARRPRRGAAGLHRPHVVLD